MASFLNYFANIRRIVIRYPGFKLTILLILIVSMISLLITSYRLDGFSISFEEMLEHYWLEYLFHYWLSHLTLLVMVFLGLTLVLALDVLEGPFTVRVRPVPPHPKDERIDQRLFVINLFLSVFLILLVLITLPLTHLCFPAWARLAIFCTETGATFLTYYALIISPETHETVKRLGKYSFKGIPSFDTASMGSQASEVRDELTFYEKISSHSPISAKVQTYLREGDPATLWNGFIKFYQSLAQFLGVSTSRITLHENTSAAIDHALLNVVESRTYLLTTDAEYDSIIQRAEKILSDKTKWIKLQIKKSLIEGSTTASDVLKMLADAANKWLEEHKTQKCKLIILTSHVYFETGTLLDVDALHKATSPDNRIIWIVDGAQAVGNINVPELLFSKFHFYATSGHKWLLGRPSIGILIHTPKRLSESHISLKNVVSISRPFSTIGFDIEADYKSESINLSPIVSLNAMLSELNTTGPKQIAEHNMTLAQQFANYVGRLRGVRVLNTPVDSSIVTLVLSVGDCGQIKAELERDHDIICQSFEMDNVLRFAFHYFMNEKDVHNLMRAFLTVYTKNTLLAYSKKVLQSVKT